MAIAFWGGLAVGAAGSGYAAHRGMEKALSGESKLNFIAPGAAVAGGITVAGGAFALEWARTMRGHADTLAVSSAAAGLGVGAVLGGIVGAISGAVVAKT